MSRMFDCGARVIDCTSGVSIPPGWIELQRIASPLSRQWIATVFVSVRTAPLLAL